VSAPRKPVEPPNEIRLSGTEKLVGHNPPLCAECRWMLRVNGDEFCRILFPMYAWEVRLQRQPCAPEGKLFSPRRPWWKRMWKP